MSEFWLGMFSGVAFWNATQIVLSFLYFGKTNTIDAESIAIYIIITLLAVIGAVYHL